MADRKEVMAERLREARLNAGYATASAAAEAFGWVAPTFISHENGTRGFDVDVALRYARALKVAPGWLLGLDQVRAPDYDPPAPKAGPRKLPVLGTVEAGIWREADPAHPDPDEIEMIDWEGPAEEGEFFAVRLRGQSMNLTLQPNVVLICRRIPFGRLEAKPGDLVIVQRTAHGLSELTCKRLAMIGGQFALVSESDRSEFATPIMIGAPDKQRHADDDVRVIGVVRRAVQDHFPPPSDRRSALG